MSSQSSQKMPRRNASPSMKQGPMKATLPFSSLVHVSPTRTSGRKGSPSLSPTSQWNQEKVKRWSPECRVSPERKSPTSSPIFKVERPKPLRPSPTTGVRFDSASQYLTGTWPRETSFLRVDTEDQYTQTPEEWEDLAYDRKKKHKRSASVGNGDLQLALYRQRLQRTTKDNSKIVVTTHRQSPVPGNHFVPPSGSTLYSPPSGSTLYAVTSSKAICIPGTGRSVPSRCSVSLEGLNQEIENFVLSKHALIDDEYKCREIVPDGHRAPVMELIRGGGPNIGTTSASGGTRSIDTQTPSGYAGDPCSGGSSSSSRCPSISPSFAMDTSRPGSGVSRSDSAGSTSSNHRQIQHQPMDEEPSEGYMEIKADDCASPDLLTSSPKNAFSPLPNKSYSFVREPPDGCEKVNITQENRLAPVMKEHLFFCPSKESQFVLKPSDRSAFCPPPYLPPAAATRSAATSAFMTSQRTTIESQ